MTARGHLGPWSPHLSACHDLRDERDISLAADHERRALVQALGDKIEDRASTIGRGSACLLHYHREGGCLVHEPQFPLCSAVGRIRTRRR
jgi:hypothetical protein